MGMLSNHEVAYTCICMQVQVSKPTRLIPRRVLICKVYNLLVR
jgi:hypothetical protein